MVLHIGLLHILKDETALWPKHIKVLLLSIHARPTTEINIPF